MFLLGGEMYYLKHNTDFEEAGDHLISVSITELGMCFASQANGL